MGCIKCGKDLTKDDIGLHKKLVNRGDEECMCVLCLAEHFEVSEAFLRKKIEEFKKIGCTLF